MCHHVLLPQAEVCVATCCYAQTGYECVSPAAIYTFGSSEKLLCYTPCCTHGYKMHVNNLITGAVLLEELEHTVGNHSFQWNKIETTEVIKGKNVS